MDGGVFVLRRFKLCIIELFLQSFSILEFFVVRRFKPCIIELIFAELEASKTKRISSSGESSSDVPPTKKKVPASAEKPEAEVTNTGLLEQDMDDMDAASLEDIMLSIVSDDSWSSSSNTPSTSRGFYGPIIRTNVPKSILEPVTAKKLAEVVMSHYNECLKVKRPFVLCDDDQPLACWPVCTISRREGGNAAMMGGNLTDDGERKFFAVKFPSIASGQEAKPKFFLYKKNLVKTHPLCLSFEGFKILIKKGPELLSYLTEIDNTPFNTAAGLVNRPDPVLLEMVSEDAKIVMQVDEINLINGPTAYRVTPNISVRLHRRTHNNHWYMDKAGVTLSPLNFFFFLHGTAGQFFSSVSKLIEDV
ncbi:MAG TPA: hypothetical protein VK133_00280, partial [Amoebophilaceae bacterium]|nr:hypothetical protein [Amoebophilaceae bacterium]